MDQLSDVNPDDFMQANQNEADKALLVKFFIKPLQDKAATLAEGRPIFRETVYVDIRIPGERDSAACRPASKADIQRFPEHYRAFRNRVSDTEEIGTPLSQWPLISRSQAEELAFFNVKTVEQLAGMPDSSNHNFRAIISLKQDAQKWLSDNKDKQALQAEFDKREQALQNQLKAMQEQLDALSAPKPKARTASKPRKVNVSNSDINS
jgi:hypothetical protein